MHAIYATPVISIHAPTRGATYNGAKYFIHCADFNPRSHEGSDGNMLLQLLSTVISIHAPTRGATYAQSATENVDVYFNPRSHEGSDLRQSASTCQKSFQSTLPRGERQLLQVTLPVSIGFQSTLPRGERPS